MAVVSLLLCWSGLAMAQTPKRGGMLRVAYGNEIAHLDFHTAPGYEMMWVAMNVGCGLVNITPDGQFVGDAAETWEVSPDGLVHTFKLRNNILFHDGTKVDAAAVKFSIDRLIDPATKSGMKTFYERGGPRRGGRSAHRAGADEASLRLLPAHAGGLSHRSGALLAHGHAKVQLWTTGKRANRRRWRAVVPSSWSSGCRGAIWSWTAGTSIFNQDCPTWTASSCAPSKTPSRRSPPSRLGRSTLLPPSRPEHVDSLKAQVPEAQILTGPETTPMVAMMKVTVPCDGKAMSKERCPHPIFGDIKMRKAIGCYGIDRQEIVQIAFKGQATPWVGMNPPGTLDTVDVNHLCPYDPAKAKALLAEAGYGPNKPLTFEIITDTETLGVQRHCHGHQGADGASWRDRQHQTGRQSHLDEHRPTRMAPGIWKWKTCCPCSRWIAMPTCRPPSGSWNQLAAYRHQDR